MATRMRPASRVRAAARRRKRSADEEEEEGLLWEECV